MCGAVEEREKVYFPAKRLALVVRERPKGISHFYLSIGVTKRDDQTFRPIKPGIDLRMLCGPLALQLIRLMHHFLD